MDSSWSSNDYQRSLYNLAANVQAAGTALQAVCSDGHLNCSTENRPRGGLCVAFKYGRGSAACFDIKGKQWGMRWKRDLLSLSLLRNYRGQRGAMKEKMKNGFEGVLVLVLSS